MAGGYSITISAVDQITSVLDGVNKRVEALNKRVAMARAPFDNMAWSFGKFTRVTGLDKIATGFKDVARGGLEAFKSISRVIEPLAVITGAASLAGIYKLVSAWGEFGTQLRNQASRASVSIQGLMELQNAARLAGVSADTLTQGLTTLADNMRSSQFESGPFTVAIRAIGLDLVKLRAMKPEDQVKAISDAINKFPKASDRAFFISQIFGGEGMIPFLAKGAKGIEELEKRARSFGLMTEESTKRADTFRMSQVGLTEAVELFGYAVADVAGPILTPLLDNLAASVALMTKWMEANRVWLGQKLDEGIQAVVKWLKDIDWAAVGTGIEDVSKAFLHVGGAVFAAIKWLDKMGLLLPAIGLALSANLIAPLAGVITKLLFLAAFSPPAWLLAIMGVSGAIAGKKNVSMVDDNGNVVGNWGGAEGERNQNDALIHGPRGTGDADDPQSLNYKPLSQRFVPLGTKIWNWATGGSEGTQGSGGARNIRNNNPTNLSFAGQPGATSDGRFAKFPNMETGVAADLNQFLLYQDRDHLKSIEGMVHKATPGSDNPGVEDYINRVAAATGHKRSDTIDLHDPVEAKKFIMAIAPNEGGTPDAGAVERGVGLRLGTLSPGGKPLEAQGDTAPPLTAPAATGAPGPNGRVDLNVRVTGQPAQVTTRSSGDLAVAQSGLLGY